MTSPIVSDSPTATGSPTVTASPTTTASPTVTASPSTSHTASASASSSVGAIPAGGFTDCAQASAAGYVNITVNSPAYAAKLDSDQDGVACEQTDATTSTSTSTAVGDPTLPVTGASITGFILIACVLVLAGVLAVVFTRKRKHGAHS